jgi:hypothetical protein
VASATGGERLSGPVWYISERVTKELFEGIKIYLGDTI